MNGSLRCKTCNFILDCTAEETVTYQQTPPMHCGVQMVMGIRGNPKDMKFAAEPAVATHNADAAAELGQALIDTEKPKKKGLFGFGGGKSKKK